jgi:hypothetical protein
MSNNNKSFPELNLIARDNRDLLERDYGSFKPEDQPCLPTINLEDGELIVPEIEITSDLLPSDKRIFFAEDPMNLPSIFRTSEGEVGLGVILPLESFQFPKGSPWDDSLTSYISHSLLLRFEQSPERKGYNNCSLLSYTDETTIRKMDDVRGGVFETEFSHQSDLDFVEDNTGFSFKKIYVSNRINKTKSSSDPAACVLMYLE